MTARCQACGQEWPRDPALEVACPACHAPEGAPCRRPSGHGCAVHEARDRLAMERGILAPCPASAPRGRAPRDGLPLFTIAHKPPQPPERTMP